MADNDCWGAFGSDSDSDSDSDGSSNNVDNDNNDIILKTLHPNKQQKQKHTNNPSFESAADATSLAITQHFASLAKSTGVLLQERVVGIGIGIGDGCHEDDDDDNDDDDDGSGDVEEEWKGMMMDRIGGRGMKVWNASNIDDDVSDDDASRDASNESTMMCDAAIVVSNDAAADCDDTDGESKHAIRRQRRRQQSRQQSRHIIKLKRALLPGGYLWLILTPPIQEGNGDPNTTITTMINDESSVIRKKKQLEKHYSQAIWDVDNASIVHSSSDIRVMSIRKRSCVVNAWSCPWMDKEQRIRAAGTATGQHRQQPQQQQQQQRQHSPTVCKQRNDTDDFPIAENETYLQYERKVAGFMTISPSVAERTRIKIDNDNDNDNDNNNNSSNATILTQSNLRNAISILRKHGMLIVKSLLPPSQTLPWGQAVLEDFERAIARLKCHPQRPVDILNPDRRGGGAAGGAFEPLSYREMAMREDLRVDLRSGPTMEALRAAESGMAARSMARRGEDGGPNSDGENGASAAAAAGARSSAGNSPNGNGPNDDGGPTVIESNCAGTHRSWRFHPSLLAIVRGAFRPRGDGDSSLYKGNFGRWNFGGAGPDGSPLPFRLGQVGSVVSCPGSGDQAIHADTPHLFEHVDCLPCHYLNVFTPGYNVTNDTNNNDDDAGKGECYKHEFDEDGIWTGNSTMGGTAFVHGSHRLSVTKQLLSEDDDDDDDDDAATGSMGTTGNNNNNNDDDTATAIRKRQLLQLRTIRPSLDAGDVVFFDCRTIHYGLANASKREKRDDDDDDGTNAHRAAAAGRRPMLYLNASQSWFHDPKNWDDRERIFD